MDEAQRKRAALLRHRLHMRWVVDEYAPDLDDLGLAYVQLSEQECWDLRKLAQKWNATPCVPELGYVEVELESTDALVTWLDEEFPLAEIGDPNIAPSEAGNPFFRVHLDGWNQIPELLDEWGTVQLCASGSGKNTAFGLSEDNPGAVTVDPRMYYLGSWPEELNETP